MAFMLNLLGENDFFLILRAILEEVKMTVKKFAVVRHICGFSVSFERGWFAFALICWLTFRFLVFQGYYRLLE
jgi:hypothetical protein